MFDGTLLGNLLGSGYLLFFQVAGIFITYHLLRQSKFSLAFLALLGSVFGSVSLQWFPILFAFFFGFSKIAHLLAVVLELFFCVVAFSVRQPKNKEGECWHLRLFCKRNPCIFFMVVTFFFFAYCLYTHTIPYADSGAMKTGQATYGDMNMHLGFITSIANQKQFPPEYSIYPGVKLSYPFLCDSISSSVYLFGASLPVAYVVPMLIAIWQVFGGFYCLIKYMFHSGKKAFVAWILFFFNGGFGFVYFLDKQSLVKNFTEFYYTPTSLGDKNFRWAQMMVNMLLPQRATLFGFAVLFPLLALLFLSVLRGEKRGFLLSGILAGALPMIHTHSFLGLGMVCVMWLYYQIKNLSGRKEKIPWLIRLFLPIGLCLFQWLSWQNEKNGWVEEKGIVLCFAGLAVLALFLAYHFFWVIKEKKTTVILQTWGIFLAVVIVLAVPQLFFWTFSQAGTQGFVHSHFNWSNEGDSYIFFYIKNIGLSFLCLLPAVFWVKKRDLQWCSPYLLIWFVAELIVFQPNNYDNNKLLFVGFVFLCGLAAEFLVDFFGNLWKKRHLLMKGVAIGLGTLCIFVGTISALLTMGREWVSDYVLYTAEDVQACRYLEQNTQEDDVILTGTEHNNPVSSLTGRNIFCGSGTFLYYHGIDYQERESLVALFYQFPIEYQEMMLEYNIQYIYVSNQERQAYSVDEKALETIAECIYNRDDVAIYRING